MDWIDKAKTWMTPERAAAFQGIGMGLSQIGAGQPVNLAPAYEALAQRKEATRLQKVMETPGLLDKFTPQQRAVLAAMPERLAIETIMGSVFAPPPEPVKGVEVGGQLVNPLTGEVIYQGQPEPPKGVNVGGALVDPTTGQVIYQGPVEEPESIRALRIRAAAAGLQEGTPEFNQFMLNGGKNEGLVIESDGAGGFRVAQGIGAGQMKPLTEGQSKDVGFATRARGAMEVLTPEKGPALDERLGYRSQRALEAVPFGLGREFQDTEYQLAKQAGDEFLMALLRKDTGAVIGPDEQVFYGGIYLPQPGDGPQLVEQKRQARARAVAGIEAGLPPSAIAAQEQALAKTAAPAAPPAPTGGIPTMSREDLLRLDPASMSEEEMDAVLKRLGELDQ
jgi:hypothetical protein